MTIKRILALDLSLTCTGYSVLEIEKGTLTLLEKGHIKNPSSKVVKKKTSKIPIGIRLNKIATTLSSIAFKYNVDEVVREASFSNSRIRATQSIFMVNGAVASRFAMNGWEKIEELAPSTIKKTIAGNGRASKEEVEKALEKYVGEQTYIKDDESDAVAVNVAYILNKKYME